MEKKFISVKEAAELLSLNASYIYRLCREGGIPATKVGRSRWVIPATAIDLIEKEAWGHYGGSNESVGDCQN